jgi:nitrite reductase/ring-hydroxylating ferredoxin subunit
VRREPADQVAAYVDALRDGRRPPRFPTDADESGGALRAAAALNAALPGADAPRREFVEGLRQRLAQAAVPTSSAGSVTRRRLLGQLALPAVAALVGAAAATAVRSVLDHLLARGGDAADTQLVPDGVGHWTAVIPLISLSPGQPRYFASGAIQGFLIRQGADVSAVSAICTHLGCVLRNGKLPGRLDCPCHGASFTLLGEPLNPEYTTPLPGLRTRVNDGTVEVFVADV